MVGLGGLNKKPIDWKHCIRCKKRFYENETKTMRPNDKGFLCEACYEIVGKKNGEDGVK